jgi:hypothetical protein
MGTWGIKLYQDDEAQDLKDDYSAMLNKGISNEEITKKLIEDNKGMIEDTDESTIFWTVLADLQWKIGRLLPQVKEKAIYYLKNNGDLHRWGESSDKDYIKRKEELERLLIQLQSEQPPEKKIYIRKPWKCDWKTGDIYAYKLTQKESESTPYKDKYVVFQKINEEQTYNDDINPIVYFYDKIFDSIPSLDELKEISFLPMYYSKMIYPKEVDNKPMYKCEMDSRRSRSFKKENLIYIGNKDVVVPKDEHFILDKNTLNYNYMALIVWKFFNFGILHHFELNLLHSKNSK